MNQLREFSDLSLWDLFRIQFAEQVLIPKQMVNGDVKHILYRKFENNLYRIKEVPVEKVPQVLQRQNFRKRWKRLLPQAAGSRRRPAK